MTSYEYIPPEQITWRDVLNNQRRVLHLHIIRRIPYLFCAYIDWSSLVYIVAHIETETAAAFARDLGRDDEYIAIEKFTNFLNVVHILMVVSGFFSLWISYPVLCDALHVLAVVNALRGRYLMYDTLWRLSSFYLLLHLIGYLMQHDLGAWILRVLPLSYVGF
jgi:hypothetical protein